MSYIGMPISSQVQQRTSTGWGSHLAGVILVVLLVALVGGGVYWLQWASQRGLELGYPMPQVHISILSSSSVVNNSSVQFSAQSPGKDLTYTWDFGDGAGGYGQSVEHNYHVNHFDQNTTTFTVTVTAVDAINQRSTDTTSVTVVPQPPTASFTFSQYYQGSADVSFDASASSADPATSIDHYSWDFGDGSTNDTYSPQTDHYYYSAGPFTVTLVVVDATGQRSNQYTATVTLQ
jgi:PKD repeat protein